MAIGRNIVLRSVAAVCSKCATNKAVQKLLFNAVRLDRPEVHDLLLQNDIRFVSYCLARRHLSRSQIMQDLWVCFELDEKRDGFFVEFGATNGLKNSNTCLLETKYGWKGILAEPNPVWHADLSANRDAAIEHRCVAGKTGEVVTFITTNDTDPELSSIEAFSSSDHFAAVRNQGERIKIPTISLDDLLEQNQAPLAIDYISIDTEGSELEILSSYSFRHRFKTISIENNPATEEPIDELLTSQGYIRVFKHLSQWDSWYVAKELRTSEEVVIFAPSS